MKGHVIHSSYMPVEMNIDYMKLFEDCFKLGAIYQGNAKKCFDHLDREMLYRTQGFVYNNLFNFKGTALRLQSGQWQNFEMQAYSSRISRATRPEHCKFSYQPSEDVVGTPCAAFDKYA